MTKQQYIDYLKYIYLPKSGKPLSDYTIGRYTKGSIDVAEEFLHKLYDPHLSIYDITDLEELITVKNIIFNDKEFKEMNSRGNRMYSAGLNRYIDYAKGKCFDNKIETIKSYDKPIAFKEFKESSDPKYRTIKQYNRNRIQVLQLERACSYQCQVDPSHETFIVNNTEHQYVEGHHIIPLNQQDNFEYSLDCYANIMILCPTCHRFFHYADQKAREERLKAVFDDREERLHKSGIDLDRKQFLEITNNAPSDKKYFVMDD